jgi:hypothetical protein
MSARCERRKKIKIQDELPEIRIHIHKNSYSEITRESDPESEWDGDDLENSHSFEGFSLVKDKGKYWDFVLHELPKKNVPYYLVYVLHSSGDSFHHESGCLCMVQFVNEYEDAVAIRDAISKDVKMDGYSVNLTLPKSGMEIRISTGTWKGYFDRLESVNIETLFLK